MWSDLSANKDYVQRTLGIGKYSAAPDFTLGIKAPTLGELDLRTNKTYDELMRKLFDAGAGQQVRNIGLANAGDASNAAFMNRGNPSSTYDRSAGASTAAMQDYFTQVGQNIATGRGNALMQNPLSALQAQLSVRLPEYGAMNDWRTLLKTQDFQKEMAKYASQQANEQSWMNMLGSLLGIGGYALGGGFK